MGPCQQGKVPGDGTYLCRCVDTPPVGPPLLSRVIHSCADVGQGVHLRGKNLHLCQNCGELEVRDRHVPSGVRVRDESGLCRRGKGGAPDEPPDVRGLADAPHTGS